MGKVERVTRTGLILVRLEKPKPPKLGWKLYAEDRRLVGTVVDVIGPVDKPFAVVRPLEGVTLTEGEPLYSMPPRPVRRRPGRRRRGPSAGRRGRRR